jgi:thiol-disulfide isomerase/thioredoxin
MQPSRPTPRRWQRWLLEGAVALAAIAALQVWFTRDVVRGQFPVLSGPLLDGSAAADWQAARRGRAHVVYVWATWCAVCKTMQGNLDAVAADSPAAAESPVLTVAMQSGSDAQVSAFLAARGLRWPTLNDPGGETSRRLGVSAVPMLFFVDPDGEIRWVTRGYTSALGIRARLWWAGQGSR